MALLNPNAPAFFPHQAPPFIPHQAPPFFPHLYYHQNTHLISSEAEEEQHAHGTLEPGKQQQLLMELHDGHNKQRRFFKFINCNHHSYEWRKKGEQVGRKIFPQSNNNDHHHFLEALPNKSIQRYPLMPVRPDGDQTTVMIRNIPSKYTRGLLVNFLENHCMQENQRARSDGVVGNENRAVLAFDCVYLPIDFKTGLNKGYAFVNFTESKAAWMFRMTASHMKWDLFKSQKICEIVAARLQGIENLENYFASMCFPCQSVEVLPVFFSPPRDGILKGGEQRTVGRLLVRH
ncbi:protein MEI2-like 6 [Lotus japonicus]|uniref:protein MEI2-like 6 n=1 Tax=Lotus japonicus TaxID=34305 RepID=UPI00258AC37B|nr:protein MEI2-like 6 [Lotus japonicus]